MGISPRSRCSARSSIALIAYSPFAEILTAVSSAPAEPALEQARRLASEIRDHDIGAGAADGGQRLEYRALLVEPAELAGRADHRVLARDRVRGQRHAELELRAGDHVEIRQRGLDHHDVGALVEVQRDLPHRLLRIRRVHLVGAAIAELRRRLRGGAEGLEEARGILRGVRHDRRLRERRLVERLADGADAAVHHVRRCDHVRARLDVRHRGAREQLERGIVLHRTVLDHTAVAVAGVLAEADVGDHEQVGHGVLHGPHRLLHDAVLRVGLRPAWILLRGDAEQQHARNAHARGVLALLDQLVDREAMLAGHRRDRLAHAAAVDDVKVTASTVAAASASPSRVLLPSARRVVYAGTSSTSTPSARSDVTRTSRVWAARGKSTRSRSPRSPRSRSTRPSARYSAGTMSTPTPCSRSASAVAGPMAATRWPARFDHVSPSALSRRSTMLTPFTLVKTSQVNVESALRAASSSSHDAG